VTTPTPASNGLHVPWKVRWALYACGIFAVLAIPGTVEDLGSRLLRNVGQILNVDDDTPIVVPLPDGNQP
jgi:hypothetical protein